jgi:hypothetical protein
MQGFKIKRSDSVGFMPEPLHEDQQRNEALLVYPGVKQALDVRHWQSGIIFAGEKARLGHTQADKDVAFAVLPPARLEEALHDKRPFPISRVAQLFSQVF